MSNSDSLYHEIYKTTDILCFECGKHFGIDCPGRKQGEATRCKDCLDKFIAQTKIEDKSYKERLENLGYDYT